MSKRPSAMLLPDPTSVTDIESARMAVTGLVKAASDLNRWASDDDFHANVPTDILLGDHAYQYDVVADAFTATHEDHHHVIVRMVGTTIGGDNYSGNLGDGTYDGQVVHVLMQCSADFIKRAQLTLEGIPLDTGLNDVPASTIEVSLTVVFQWSEDEGEWAKVEQVFRDNVTLSGAVANGEGTDTTASGDNSHAEGLRTIASGDSSHSEGADTTASGVTGHAEGNATTASNVASHAQGQGTTADGLYSDANGFNTTSSGTASSSRGGNTTAGHDYSMADGIQSSTTWPTQRVLASGRFATDGDAQISEVALMRQTADGASTELTIGGGAPGATSRYLIATDMMQLVEIAIVGAIAGVGTVASFHRKCTIANASGTTALVGTDDTIGTDQNAGGWGGVTIQADDTNDSLQVMVSGAAATTIRWVAKVTATSLTFAA